jgi:hypothetical protein
LGDPDHPKELVNVIPERESDRIAKSAIEQDVESESGEQSAGRVTNEPGVTEKATKDDEDVVNVVLLEDRVRHLFGRGHGLSNGPDVS